MSRLIIVDQSLKGLGGHHFDYTLQVAKAAAGRQCEVIVATNRKFRACSRLDHFARIHPVFRNTSYSRYSLLAGLRAMFGQPPMELAENQKNSPLRFVEESPMGRAARAKQAFGLQIAKLTSMRTRMNSRWKYLRESTGRNRVVKSFARDCQSLFRTVGLQPSDHVFFPTVSDLDLAGLLTYWMSNPESHLPVWHMQFHFDVFVGRSPDYRRQLPNLNPLRDLFDDVERAVPSFQLNYYATTAAIADQYQRLCRRQVSELAYPISDGFLNQPPNQFTDSLGLLTTQSFEKPQTGKVVNDSKIPNPFSVDLAGSVWTSASDQPSLSLPNDDSHLTKSETCSSENFVDHEEKDNFRFPSQFHGVPIVVAGGVRGEKGQACLTKLLPEMDEKIFANDWGFLVCQRKQQKKWWKKPTFSLCKNSSNEFPEKSSHSESHLREDLFSKSICYLPHPLEPRNYQQLIRQAGIGLLSYDRDSYANRRAGIFGEYLAAGVPVLVPAGTWMADQLATPHREYLQRLRTELDLLQRIPFHHLNWADWNVPTANGAVSFDGMEVPAYAWSPELDSPSDSDHLRMMRIAFDWLWPKEAGTYCKVQLLFHSQDNQVLGSSSCIVGGAGESRGCEALFKVPSETGTIRFGFSNAYHERNASIQNLRIELLEVPHSVPLGAVGLTYDSMEQIPELLAEMCFHHSHYRYEAKKFSQSWYDGHDPIQTVTQLTSTSQSASSWAA